MQCYGSGSASFWELGSASGSASAKNYNPDPHQSCECATLFHRISASQTNLVKNLLNYHLGRFWIRTNKNQDPDPHPIRIRIRIKVIRRIRIRIRIRNKVMRILNTGAAYRWRHGRDGSTPCWIPATPRTTFPSLPVSQVSRTYDFIV